jgi:hypothetical protein
MVHHGHTYAGLLDLVCNLHEELLILGGVLATNQNLNRESASLELFEMFCWYRMLELPLFDALGNRCTFFSSREDVQCIEREQHQGGRELVAKKPELQQIQVVSIEAI